MALNTTAIKNALLANYPGTPTTAQQDAAAALAAAIVATIETATINYLSGLVAPPGGGPVTGVFAGTLS
jgi:hypothetical protein